MRRDLGGFARIEARCCNRPMRRTHPRTTVHCLLLACALLAGRLLLEDDSSTDGSAGGRAEGAARAGPAAPAGRPAAPARRTTGGSGGTAGPAARASAVRDRRPQGAPKLCGEIRNCVIRCGTPACAQACVDQAPAAARTKYQAVTTCSKAGCAENDINCRCDRECLEPGQCVPVVDECREGVEDDTFCDEQCH